MMSRGVSFLWYVNLKGHEVAENIAKNVYVNPRMPSTLKNKRSI